MKDKSAFTLIEVMIGVFIISVIGLTTFLVIKSSSEESQFSGNHFSAMMVSQKVAEDIIEEFSLNPYADETLVLKQGENSSFIDGGSVFFMAIEDTKPPWGVIDSAVDGGITPKHEPLYSQLKGFRLRTSAEKHPLPGISAEDSNLIKVNVKTTWNNDIGLGNSEKSFLVFSPRKAKNFTNPLDSVSVSDSLVESGIKSLVPAGVDKNRPLSSILSEIGANEILIKKLGFAKAVTQAFLKSDSVKEITKRCSYLKIRLGFVTNRETECKIRQELAKKWYDLANLSFNVLTVVSDSMGMLAIDSRSESSMQKLNSQQLKKDMIDMKLVYRYFLDSMNSARYNYRLLIGRNMAEQIGTRKQQKIILRLVDINRILSFAPGYPDGKANYRNFIREVREMTAWRNQSMFRFVDQEKKLATNKTELLKKFPNLTPVHQVLTIDVARMVAFINEQVSKL